MRNKKCEFCGSIIEKRKFSFLCKPLHYYVCEKPDHSAMTEYRKSYYSLDLNNQYQIYSSQNYFAIYGIKGDNMVNVMSDRKPLLDGLGLIKIKGLTVAKIKTILMLT